MQQLTVSYPVNLWSSFYLTHLCVFYPFRIMLRLLSDLFLNRSISFHSIYDLIFSFFLNVMILALTVWFSLLCWCRTSFWFRPWRWRCCYFGRLWFLDGLRGLSLIWQISIKLVWERWCFEIIVSFGIRACYLIFSRSWWLVMKMINNIRVLFLLFL